MSPLCLSLLIFSFLPLVLSFASPGLMHKYGAHGATDVTGFGLIGHASNLAKHQKGDVSFKIHTLPSTSLVTLLCAQPHTLHTVLPHMVAVNSVVSFKLLQGFSAETSGIVCVHARVTWSHLFVPRWTAGVFAC